MHSHSVLKRCSSILALTAALLLLFPACEKDDAPASDKSGGLTFSTPDAAAHPNLGKAEGYLVATRARIVESIPGTGWRQRFVNRASAVFYTTDNMSVSVNVDTVWCEDQMLQFPNAPEERYLSGTSLFEEFPFEDAIRWKIKGDTANTDYTGFSVSMNRGFPLEPELASDTVIVLSEGYRLENERTSLQADSVVYQMIDHKGRSVTKSRDATVVDFTAEDMAILAPGPGFIRISSANFRRLKGLVPDKEIVAVQQQVLLTAVRFE